MIGSSISVGRIKMPSIDAEAACKGEGGKFALGIPIPIPAMNL